MRQIKIVGLCLVAVFAFSAVAAGSASASQPEYMKCAKASPKNTGGFNDKACTSVNGGGTGAYALSPLSPTAFEGKSKATTFYYSKAGKIVWEIVCKKDKITGAIESTSLEGLITFETCEVKNEITKAKGVKCTENLEVPVAGLLREETVPAIAHPGITLVFFAPAYTCGGATFEDTTAFPFITGEVSPTKKGELGVFTVNKTTGAQSIEQWVEEGKPTTWAPLEAEVTSGASSESLRVGLETSEPLGPKKEVVIR